MTCFPDDQEPTPLSDPAAEIASGVARALLDADHGVLTELPLANSRRADVVAIDKAGKITIVEIKSCLADFRSDHKWHHYLDYGDLFYFAVNDDFPLDVLPEDEGLMIADRYGAEILRPATSRALSAARRKAMLIRFARLAAGRLHNKTDQFHSSY